MDAAVGPIKVPDNATDEQALFLSDIIPSASGRYRSRVDRRKQTIEPERSKLTVSMAPDLSRAAAGTINARRS